MQRKSIHKEDLSVYQEGWHQNDLSRLLYSNLDSFKKAVIPWIKIHSAILKNKKSFTVAEYAKYETEMGIFLPHS
jgi:hypothetical protein